MSANSRSTRQAILKGLVALAAARGTVPDAATAQDCRMLVQAAAPIVYRGQSTRVKVFVCPSDPSDSNDPNAPYAFASADFDIRATDAQWSFATDGVIVDGEVRGIEVGQDHQPQLGIYADPSNPYWVWGGVIKPQSEEPALVEIGVEPTEFSVYPSKETSSSVECVAEGDRDVIFVNPLTVGRWLAAPGQGTKIGVAADVMIDGRIITGENWDSVSVGTTWTGSALLESSSTVGFDREPSSFKVNVQILGAGDDVFQWDPGDGVDAVRPDAQRSRIGSMTVSFDGLENQGGHIGGANFSFSDGSVRPVRYSAYVGGVFVASGDLDDGGDHGIPGLVVYDLPQTIKATTGRNTLMLSTANTYTGMTMVYDQPIVATIRNSRGLPRVVTLDRIEVYSVGKTTTRRQSAISPPRMLLGSHVFEAHGVKEMRITPSQGK